MIIWNCNFSIPNATIQVATAHLYVTDVSIHGDTASATVSIMDETDTMEIDRLIREYNGTFGTVDDVVNEVIKDYPGSFLA